MTRVSNLATNKLINSTLLRTQDRMLDRQLQISSLQKSQDYAGIATDANRLVTLESSLRRVDQFLAEGSNVKLRMDTSLNSIDSLKTTLSDVRKLVQDVLDDGALPTGIDKDSFCQVKISEIQDFLNVNVGGRFLFAGSATSTKPVSNADYSTAPTYDASFNTIAEPSFYYQGDDTKLSARLNEGLDVQYGVTANDPAFENLIRAVRIVRSTATNDPDILAKFGEAQRLLNDAQAGMQAVELNVGTKIEQSGRTEETLKTTKAFLEGTISDFESADTFTAVSELQQDQTMLEASYNVLVRLSNLSLNNFLT